jgi:hypothetical protein
MKNKEITIVKAEEWQGLYVDNQLVIEEHQLSVEDVMYHCGIDCNFIEATPAVEEYLMSNGRLPERLR